MGNLQSASLLFAFLDIRDSWAPIEEFIPNKKQDKWPVFVPYLKGIIVARTKKGKNSV